MTSHHCSEAFVFPIEEHYDERERTGRSDEGRGCDPVGSRAVRLLCHQQNRKGTI